MFSDLLTSLELFQKFFSIVNENALLLLYKVVFSLTTLIGSLVHIYIKVIYI